MNGSCWKDVLCLLEPSFSKLCREFELLEEGNGRNHGLAKGT